jgi:hypothetical protein
MSWCEHNGIDYVFGLTGTKPLARRLDAIADAVRSRLRDRNLLTHSF